MSTQKQRSSGPAFFPDTPKLRKSPLLATLKDGEWIAQVKEAGWRAVVSWDGQAATVTSKEGKPIKISHAIRGQLEALLRGTPPATFDTEYTGPQDEREEGFVFFDQVQDETGWIGDQPLRARLEKLALIFRRPRKGVGASIRMSTGRDHGYPAFFDETRDMTGVEGLVLKRADSTYIGSRKKPSTNPGWLKFKHREGVPSKELPTTAEKDQERADARSRAAEARAPKPARGAATAPLEPEGSEKYSPELHRFLRPIDSLTPDPENARAHPEWNLEAIRNSLARFGQQRPIIVDKAGVIRAGNGQWLAAKELGWKRIAAVTTELTGKELVAFAIADNRTGELSEWNEDTLAQLLTGLDADMRDASGFKESDLAKLMEGGTDSKIDWTPEVEPRKAITRSGDLWTLGRHRLLCGDSKDPITWRRILGTAKAKMVFTDPPYGVSYTTEGGETVMNDEKRDDELLKLLAAIFKLTAKHTEETAGWYIWHATTTRNDFEHAMRAAGLIERTTIIWVKPTPAMGRGDYQWAHEPCFYASRAGQTPKFYGDRTQQTIWRVTFKGAKEVATVVGTGIEVLDGQGNRLWIQDKAPKAKKARKVRIDDGQVLHLVGGNAQGTAWEVSRESATVHPTQKPVELAKRAIENSSLPGELVVDPFMGSGTTLIAAELLGRAAAGAELKPEHCDSIVLRWQELTGLEATRTDANGRELRGIPRKAPEGER